MPAITVLADAQSAGEVSTEGLEGGSRPSILRGDNWGDPRIPVRTFLSYLDDVVERLPFEMMQERIVDLDRHVTGFRALSSRGVEIEARAVVVATGLGSHCHVPPPLDSLSAEEWWTDVQPKVDCFVSPFVIQEASRGDSEMAARRLEAIAEFPVLAESETVDELAQRYFAKMSIPERAKIDAFHLAMAVGYEMDYLLSWNCRHIASAQVQKTIQKMNEDFDLLTPVMRTPEALMEV